MDKILEILAENYLYIAIGSGVIIVILLLIIMLGNKKGKKKEEIGVQNNSIDMSASDAVALQPQPISVVEEPTPIVNEPVVESTYNYETTPFEAQAVEAVNTPVVEPIAPVEPVVPTVEPVVSAEPVVPTVEPVVSAEPVVPTVEPVAPVEPAVPTVEPVAPVEPAVPTVEPVAPVEPAEEVSANKAEEPEKLEVFGLE